jgi:hypothetical protein
MSIYSDEFYEQQVNKAYRSAFVYASILKKYFNPQQIMDIGCGRGAWLKAFSEINKNSNVNLEVYGLDGPWNSKDKLIINVNDYFSIDLNQLKNFEFNKKVDLIISVETAEHLYPESTESFINRLCDLSDVILFSGAFLGQGGVHHFNERKHSDWASFFIKNGFFVYDIFRPLVWGDSNVNYWYQQNVFLYVKSGSPLINNLSKYGFDPIVNFDFLDCVHYKAFENRSTFVGLLKQKAQNVFPASLTILLSNIKSRLFMN